MAWPCVDYHAEDVSANHTLSQTEDSGLDSRRNRSDTEPESLDTREEVKKRINAFLEKPRYSVVLFYRKEGLWQSIVRHQVFENITLAVISLNAIWMAVDTNYNDAETLLESDHIFQLAEHFFCIYFSFEWYVRFMSFQHKVDGAKDAWFVFDTMLVLMMIAETWMMSAISAITGSSGKPPMDPSILRLFRLLRLSRMVRMLRSCPELLILVKGMASAMKSVFYVMCLLVLFMYVFAIGVTQMTSGTEVGSQYFSSVLHSMKTLLLAGVFLDNFGIVCDDIKRDDALSLIAFFVFVLLGNLTVINMLIGVLCEVVSDVAKIEKESISVELIKERMKVILGKLDENGDMQISKDEFYGALMEREATLALHDVGIDPVSLVDLADYIFRDGKELSFEEFMTEVLRLRDSNNATSQDCVALQNMVETHLAGQDSSSVDSMGPSSSCKAKTGRMSSRHGCNVRAPSCVDKARLDQGPAQVVEQQQLRCSIARHREHTSRLEVKLHGVLGELQQLRSKVAASRSKDHSPAKSISCRLTPASLIPHRRHLQLVPA